MNPASLQPSRAPVSGRTRDWRRDLAIFLALALAVTVLFAATPLDIAAARVFYRPNEVNHWPLATRLPWSVLYRLAPWITASLILAGLAMLTAGVARRRDALRRHAVFVLLSVVLGPGILINGLFKDHWDRPRPRDVIQLGGTMPYATAPLRGEGGASFPCGHCSVGFLYGMGWWIWRRRHPSWAAASMAVGLGVGTALGLGRMAAGGHFLSDVAWSALIALGMAHLLYHYVLRIPAHEAAASVAVGGDEKARRWQRALAVLAALGGVAVLVALFATPHGTQLLTDIRLSSFSSRPQVFEFTARTANVTIAIVDSPPARVSVSGELHGFGFPTSRLRAVTQFVAEPAPTLGYRIEQRGWFTDLSGSALITLPAGAFKRIVVRLQKGNIEVTDASRVGVVASGALQLDLRTDSGHVVENRKADRH
jgi:lipid A 4'-phosphatase